MAFIRYKQRGTKWYVYEVATTWDKALKNIFRKALTSVQQQKMVEAILKNRYS